MQIQVQQKAEDPADQQGQLDPAAPRFQGFVYSFNTTSGRGAVRQAPGHELGSISTLSMGPG